MEKYTRTFLVTSSLGLHARPSVDLAKVIDNYLSRRELTEIDISSDGNHLHYDTSSDPPDPCKIAEMRAEMGDEVEISIKTNAWLREMIFGSIQEVFDMRYTRDEDDPEKSLIVHQKC